ncbi:MAG: transposase [Kiloniellales bacterium]
MKEGQNAINWTHLSCHSFRNNEVRLQPHGLAYNLGNFLRALDRIRIDRSHWRVRSIL